MDDESGGALRLLREFADRVGRHDPRNELDAAAADLFQAFDDANVVALLLKGPVLARVLYESGEERMYSDVDILVEPAALERARGVLRGRGCLRVDDGLGFEDVRAGFHSEEWLLGHVTVDLHWRLPATDATPDVTWRALYGAHEVIDLGGCRVATLGPAGLAFHVAIHAAWHADLGGPPLRDLELALERWPRAVWENANALSGVVGAREAFAAGLQLAPAGREMARALALPDAGQLNWAPVNEWPRGTYHVRAFASAGSMAGRARIVRSAFLPPSRWIVGEYPWARRWRPLEIVAYAVHLVRAPLWGSRALRFQRKRARRPVNKAR